MKISNLPRHGVRRLIFRLPILLYQAHLGWILGGRFLMLTHTGRKSGKPRRVVLEVVAHNQPAGIYTIASGWEKDSDWYRNILTHPGVLVHAGRRQFAAQAVPLTAEEAKTVLRDYARRHPFSFRELAGLIASVKSKDPEALIQAMAAAIPRVDLRQERKEGQAWD